MRKLTKLLIPAIVLVAVVMAFSVMTVSAAEATQLEWTGGTSAEAIAFLDNAMKAAEAGNDVVVTLKDNMAISHSSRTTVILGTDTTTDKVVTINGEANGDTRYGISVCKNTYLNFKGNVTFGAVALDGAYAWSSGGAIGCSEGNAVVTAEVITGKEAAKRLNLYGNVEVYTGKYRSIGGNIYGNTVTVADPVITVAGDAWAEQIFGRGQACYTTFVGVTGTSTVNVLDKAYANDVTGGAWQVKNAVAGDSIVNLNTEGTISRVYLFGSTSNYDVNFDNGGKNSHYTLNVLGGKVSTIRLFYVQKGQVKNLDATFNFGNAEYKSMIFTGLEEPACYKTNTDKTITVTDQTGYDYPVSLIDSKIEVNITGGKFASDVYLGSHFEYNSPKDADGSYDAADRVINISGGEFAKTVVGGSYAKYGVAPHRGNTVMNITGGTFKNFVYGGSRLLTAAGEHSGDIDMTISGGTFNSHLLGASYMSIASASHTGSTTFTINNYFVAKNRVCGGSLSTAGNHKGDVTVILDNSGKAASIANGITSGSYIDSAKGMHTGNTELIIKGTADWNTTIYGGSLVAYEGITVCPVATPRKATVTLDSTYTGDVATIVAGHWYNTTTAYANRYVYNSMDACDFTINVNGGLVSSVIGHSTTSAGNQTPGTTTININKGTVFKVEGYTKADTGSKVIINANATATRVPGIIGYTSGVVGDNVYVNYDRKVTRDDEIKNVKEANIVATGAESSQPPVFTYTLYVANESKGLGDGSSPENAMGHDADYYEQKNLAYWIIKGNEGTNSGLQGDYKTTVANVYKKNALYKAMTYKGSRIQAMGGTIVVCDVLTIDSTDAMRFPQKGLGDFWAGGNSNPANCKAGEITITSLDPNTGVDYRWKGARLVLDGADFGVTLNFNTPTTLDHLTIENRYNSANGKSIDLLPVIAAMGNKFVVGYDVFVWSNDINPAEDKRVDLYPSIMGGHRYTNTKKDHYVTVGSGTWAAVVGGSWNIGHTGNTTVAIDGTAKVTTVCGSVKPTSSNAKHNIDGSCWIGLWGGEVDNVYVVGKPGMIWGDASVGVGGTKINGKVRATHPDYAGDPIQGWAFNYTDAQLEEGKFVGFDNPVPETGSNLVIYAVVAAVSLLGAAIVISVKRKSVEE